jgi:hypothetical protein
MEAISCIINQALPLEQIPAAAESNVVILPSVVRKQGEPDRDGEGQRCD